MAKSLYMGSDFDGSVLRVSEDKECGLCKVKDNRASPASWHCSDCDSLICNSCKDWHMAVPALRKHKIQHFEEGESHTEPADGMCGQHKGRIVYYFCTSHGNYCCGLCLGGLHKTCTDVAPLDKPRKKTSNFVKDFDVRFPGDTESQWIVGSTFLPDGRLLLVDFKNKKLKVFDSNFKVLNGKHFQSGPVSVAAYDVDEVAVSVRDEKRIYRLAITTPIEFKGTIEVGIKCHGLAYIDNATLVTASASESPDMLKIMKTDGTEIAVIDNHAVGGSLDVPCHIDLDPQHKIVCVSNWRGGNICAIDLNARKVLFDINLSEVTDPEGIAVDMDGNIYVCGGKTSKVYQIAPGGQVLGCILEETDGLTKGCRTLCFGPDGHTLVVRCDGGYNAKVYQVLHAGHDT